VDPKTREEALEWGPIELGCGVVVVELTDQMVEDAFDDSLRWWISRRGMRRHAVTNISQGVQVYSMPDDTDEVLDVWFPGVQLDAIAALQPYAFIDVDLIPTSYQSMSGIPGGMFYGTFSQILAHAETARRVISSEPAWRWFQERNELHLFPRLHASGVAIVRYISNILRTEDPVEPAETPRNDFRNLRFRDRDLILRFFLATMKQKLGRIRGKFQSLPGAGGEKTLDGQDLLTEAREDVRELNEEIQGLSDGVPFLTG